MELNTSVENQKLLYARRNRLLRNPTKAELHVKSVLEKAGVDFHFQKGFYTRYAHFIVDFYFPKPHKLCLEIDGPYHERQLAYDKRRSEYLRNERGFKVARITNEAALDLTTDTVKTEIFRERGNDE